MQEYIAKLGHTFISICSFSLQGRNDSQQIGIKFILGLQLFFVIQYCMRSSLFTSPVCPGCNSILLSGFPDMKGDVTTTRIPAITSKKFLFLCGLVPPRSVQVNPSRSKSTHCWIHIEIWQELGLTFAAGCRYTHI